MNGSNIESTKGLNSLSLRVIAMIAMLGDHMWFTIVEGNDWLTYVGRIAFPIFAFLLVEGFYHSSNRGKYFSRLFIFAIFSELPFNLMVNGTFAYSKHQNVLWTLLIGLLVMMVIEIVRNKLDNVMVTGIVTIVVSYFGYYIATSSVVDYSGYGILTIVLFYTCYNLRYAWIGQLIGLIYINCFMLIGQTIPLHLFGNTFELPIQSFAILSLFFIWKYNKQLGPHNKYAQYSFYLFYPLHMLILAILVFYNVQLVF